MYSLSETDMTKNTYTGRALNNVSEATNTVGTSIAKGIDKLTDKINNTIGELELPKTRDNLFGKEETNVEMSQEDNTEYSCTTLHIPYMRYIGKKSEIYDNTFKNKCDINYIPLKNLPSMYFPFYYSNIKITKEFINRLISGLNDYELDNVMFDISNINQSYQPYNKNNINIITYTIIIFWIFIVYFILRFIYIRYNYMHLYVILGLTFILLLLASLWSLIITSQNI
jgi:hypothetical protein